MSDGDALLRAILLNPAEDTPRLVYADWLQENGGDEYAEFIRGSVEIAVIARANRAGLGTIDSDVRQEDLFYREAVLSRTVYPRHVHPVFNWLTSVGIDYGSCVFNRGDFLAEISCTLATFMEHAKALFSAHPIERVTLTDRLALGDDLLDGGLYRSWNRDRTRIQSMWPNFSYYLPAPIFDRLKDGDLIRDPQGIEEFRRYTVYQQPAYADLSQACVAYGRSLAGLPALLPVPLSPAM